MEILIAPFISLVVIFGEVSIAIYFSPNVYKKDHEKNE